MNLRLRIYIILVCLIAMAPMANEALADFEGTSGKLVGLQIVQEGSDTESKFHGSIFIRERSGPVQEYKWGGTTCTGMVSVVDSDIANFSRLMNARPFVRIIPIYKNGQGGSRCIKRYIMVNKSFEDDIEFTVD